ncbi:ATP-dependent helicase [Vaccinium witches'-broom phytoplasma]|uniref:ATP-dependent helicase n=1 Tax=Vaccinium witches'-broom phytoplasma TaxID=85642 RepID=UPI0003800107|nr:ATP-dependent helicase [Vaccinium witches'-broom phytoplasma]
MLQPKWLKNLNSEQLKAVTYPDRSLFVLAGPGTGKTKTLTNRIAYLLEQKNIKSENILAITFTNNAAKEMKKNLKKIVNTEFYNLTIKTFNDLSTQILRKYIDKLNFGMDSSFAIISENEGQSIIKENMKKLGINKDSYKVLEIQSYISKIKKQFAKKEIVNNILTNETDDLLLKKEYNEINFISPEMKKIYDEYCHFFKTNNLVDCDDLIIYSYQLLKNNHSVASFYQKKFAYLLVDECQDIDLIQYKLIKIIGKKSVIFLAGDPNQTIYRFKYKDVICQMLFEKDFKADMYTLNANYRSTQNILSKANMLIGHNYESQTNQPFQKELQSVYDSGEQVVYNDFLTAKQEAKYITKKIKDLIKTGKYNYNDICILYRINNLGTDIENHFLLDNIPYFIKNSYSFYQKKEIKDMIAYIHVVLSNKHNFFLKRIINIPKRQIGIKTMEFLEDIAKQHNISSLLETIDYIPPDRNNKAKFVNFKKTLEMIQDIIFNDDTTNLSNIIEKIDDIIGYSRMLNEQEEKLSHYNNYDKKLANQEKKANIIRLQEIFSHEDLNHKGTFLEKLRIVLDKISLFNEDKLINDKNKVVLSTIKKTKGLEFKVVFAIGFEDQIFMENLLDKKNSDSSSPPSEILIKEARSLAYLAITRAKELLYISSSGSRYLLGHRFFLKPVSFIKEMHLISYFNKKIDKYFSNKPSYRIGDQLIHQTFGQGVLLSIQKNIATISFDDENHGVKKILITHFSLMKSDNTNL